MPGGGAASPTTPDPNQKLIDSIGSLVAALHVIKGSTTQTAVSTTTPSSANEILQQQALQFDSFNPDNESFDYYTKRLENYFLLKGLNATTPDVDSAKVRLLIHCIGSKYFQLLSDLCAPDEPSTKKYDELVKLLKDNVMPKQNVLTEQHRFFSSKQEPNTSLSQYLATLKKLAKSANFTSHCKDDTCSKTFLDVMIRAQFIRGITDNYIRESLLVLGDKPLAEILTTAFSVEASRVHNRDYNSNPTSTGDSVHRVSDRQSRGSSHSRYRRRSRSRTPGPPHQRYRNRSQSRGRRSDFFRRLGLEGICLHCGRNNHSTKDCASVNKLKCDHCHKQGHIEKVCIKKLTAHSQAPTLPSGNQMASASYVSTHEDAEVYSFNHIENVNFNGPQNDCYMVPVTLNGTNYTFELDTGSRLTIMYEQTFRNLRLNVPIKPTNLIFRSYTGHIFTPTGVVQVTVRYKDIIKVLEIYLVDFQRSSILGRKWARILRLNLQELEEVQFVTERSLPSSMSPAPPDKPDTAAMTLKNRYSDLFAKKIGLVPNYQCSLKLREKAQPKYVKARSIPYALHAAVQKELETLESQGIIEKVQHSDWGTPIVIVKQGEKLRICADYKVTVNQQLENATYPIPKVTEIFDKLRGGRYFCKIDIHKAYLHLAVDEESAKIQTISTPFGAYKVKRLFFGIKTAPNEFHKFIDELIQGLEGTASFFDDIAVQGSTLQECYERACRLLDRLRENFIHLNPDKAKLFVPEIEYLGHQIGAEGIRKSPEKIRAIAEAPRPTTVEGVRQFLGLVRYYHRFIPNAPDLLQPLDELLRADTDFKWTDACEASFLAAKKELASDRVLTPFNPDWPIILATDAGPNGFAAVLSHRFPNGEERPISYASRTLTAAEKGYDQLIKEATAAYWGCVKYFDYLYGRHFILQIDNKPLSQIFHPDKTLPPLTASRLLRYAIFLSGLNYTVEHRKSEEHANADYFSRNALPLSPEEANRVDVDYITYEQTVHWITSAAVTYTDIQHETAKDPELSPILHGEAQTENPEYTVHQGIVFRGTRVCIPASLQSQMLAELHHTHVGITKMKSLARQYCYWPKIDSDIEALVKSCRPCCDVRKMPKKAPPHSWDQPTGPWQRVHMDYAGPFQGYHFFLLVDAYSKWLEVYFSPKAPSSASTINYLSDIFARWGLPTTLASDNASIFLSAEFVDFCNRNHIIQKHCAPGHPATNGQAERFVQTFKDKLKRLTDAPGNMTDKVREILFRYRATPLADGSTPAELLTGRKLRTRLDLIRPPPLTKVHKPTSEPGLRSLHVGDRVQSRAYQQRHRWNYGTIIAKKGSRHYMVRLDSGHVQKRHINQLLATRIGCTSTPTPPPLPAPTVLSAAMTLPPTTNPPPASTAPSPLRQPTPTPPRPPTPPRQQTPPATPPQVLQPPRSPVQLPPAPQTPPPIRPKLPPPGTRPLRSILRNEHDYASRYPEPTRRSERGLKPKVRFQCEE